MIIESNWPINLKRVSCNYESVLIGSQSTLHITWLTDDKSKPRNSYLIIAPSSNKHVMV